MKFVSSIPFGLAILTALVAGVIWLTSLPFFRRLKGLANDGALTVGEHESAHITVFCDDAPYSYRFLLVKQNVTGTGDNHVVLCSSTLDMPLGVCTDQPLLSTDPVNCSGLCGAGSTQKMTAGGAIPAGVPVVTDGTGRIRVVPSVAGLYWCVGYSRTTALVSGDLVEVMPCLYPIGVDVIT